MQALVLFSGGMDSTIALYWARATFEVVNAISFYYQQTHSREVDCAAEIFSLAGTGRYGRSLGKIYCVELDASIFSSYSSILGSCDIAEYDTAEEAGRANKTDPSYIPLRNAIFLAIAGHRLLTIAPCGGYIVTGFRGRAFEDGGGFPDGSPEFADSMSTTLSIGGLGSMSGITVIDPSNRPGRTRVDALRLAEQLPGCWEALSYTMTCFKGVEPPCGRCLPCKRRAQGFADFGRADPLLERIGRDRSG